MDRHLNAIIVAVKQYRLVEEGVILPIRFQADFAMQREK
jgi:hypothetical protein